MEKHDLWIIILFFLIILAFILTIYQINEFAPIVKDCEDDFNIINECGCVPCSWKNAEEYNKEPCMIINFTNG
jgi:hypothetical protein